MLYKKIHRQYVRQFWRGRKYKFFSVWEVIKEPYIDEGYIKIGISKYGVEDKIEDTLMSIAGGYSVWHKAKDVIEWLN